MNLKKQAYISKRVIFNFAIWLHYACGDSEGNPNTDIQFTNLSAII